MHEVLVNRLGGLSLSRKSVVRLTDRPDMTLDVYRGRKTTIQKYNNLFKFERCILNFFFALLYFRHATLQADPNHGLLLLSLRLLDVAVLKLALTLSKKIFDSWLDILSVKF